MEIKNLTGKVLPVILTLLLLITGASCKSDFEKFLEDYEGSELLPKVHINTPGGVEITSKDIWTEGCEITIVDEDGNISLDATTSLRGRGNSTWLYPKKPYAIKLDSKASVLGMPKHKRWVLLANWMDRTLMRNAVSFEMARQIMDWVPRGKFVELFLNGEYQGNYYLCEQIKIDKNRVNIKEFDDESTDGESGGYLLEFDTNYQGEINYFKTSSYNYPVTIKDPDEDCITSWKHPLYTYIQEFVNEADNAAQEYDNDKLLSKIDLSSFVNFFLIYEITTNTEPLNPKSCYMHKDAGADTKLKAGPVWDFDWATFSPDKEGILNGNALWYSSLMNSTEFKSALKKRWTEVKPIFENIDSFINEQADLIRDSEAINHQMWPIDDRHNYPNGDEKLSFDEAIERMKEVIDNRIEELDAIINSL